MITTQTRVIDTDDLPNVIAKINAANAKAVKIGVPGYVLVEGEQGSRDITVPDPLYPGSFKVIGAVDTIEVTVLGEAPKYAGWTFVGSLAWDEVSGEAVLRKVEGLDIDTAGHKPQVQFCDHCQTARFRNATYLLAHEDGSFKQVGSTCLRDFLGVKVNLDLIGFNPYEDCDSTNRYLPSRLAAVAVLHDTLALIRAYGWLSAGVAYERGGISTKERLATAYFEHSPSNKAAAEYRAALAANHQDGDDVLAVEILRWVREDMAAGSEYAENLRSALAADTFRVDNLGLVVSAVTAHQRVLDKAAEKAADALSRLNEYVGTVGERLRALRLTVVSTRWITSDWGTSQLIIMRDEAGHTFKWFSTSHEAEAGDVLHLDGTVKKHEEYNGLKGTMLTRCSVKAVEHAA